MPLRPSRMRGGGLFFDKNKAGHVVLLNREIIAAGPG